jgi:Spy/CpxP family protein refolding chaperone
MKIEEPDIPTRQRVNQFIDWGVRLLVLGCFLFVWKMYESQNQFLRKLDMTDSQVAQLQKDMARIEGNMVTMETLKRVELYMELLMSRAGVDKKVDLTSKELKK